MRYNKIRKMDISNGPGVRVSIFMQGCQFNCPGCFNQETHDFRGGKEFNQATIDRVLELCASDTVVGLSILGGEPMHPRNIDGTTELCKAFKAKYPNKTIWAWSGYLYEEYFTDKEVLKYLDVLVDGQFVQELHDFRLEWRGSKNQRVIDVKKSLQENKVVSYPIEF